MTKLEKLGLMLRQDHILLNEFQDHVSSVKVKVNVKMKKVECTSTLQWYSALV